MSELWIAYWPIVLVGLLIGLAVGILLFRPRQKIKLSDDIPVRPHMAQPVAPKPSGGEPLHDELPNYSSGADDLKQMKGVGPKLAAMLGEHGLTRCDQIADLSPERIAAVDRDLGAFRGRFERDRIVEQARFLASGDLDGYRARFGALEQSGGS